MQLLFFQQLNLNQLERNSVSVSGPSAQLTGIEMEMEPESSLRVRTLEQVPSPAEFESLIESTNVPAVNFRFRPNQFIYFNQIVLLSAWSSLSALDCNNSLCLCD